MDFDAVTTRAGDSGRSGAYSGEQLAKDDPLFEFLGTLDELNSWLGLIKAAVRHGLEVGFQDALSSDRHIDAVQRNLHRIAAQTATSPQSELYKALDPLTAADLSALEGQEKALISATKIDEDFIVPGGTRLGATIDIARTVCRRAERRYVTWLQGRDLPIPLKYLNRLSDYLFVLARTYEG